MAMNRSKTEVGSLREGMFVSDLDRPWHETPFPLQGFYIRDDEDVKALAQYCRHVYIDVKRQKSSDYEPHARFNPKRKQAQKVEQDTANVLKLPPIKIKAPVSYQSSASIKKEVSKASRLHKHIYEAIDNVFSSVQYGGSVSVKETESVADGMVDSVIRNPDALVWLAKMNEEDAHSYQHVVKASIWALVFGRHLGLEKHLLKTLAMGVLLSHIGKTRLSQETLEQAANPDTMDKEALKDFRSYVLAGVEILEDMESLPAGVIAIARYHQERHNGSGYPQGLTGDRIPLLAKIAGLVDYYQELITPRDTSRGMSPLEAVSCLYELRNILFQQDLVERFIEAVGVYPTGTLVELSSGEVAIVMGHNMDRRLMPKVLVVLDENKQPLKAGRPLDLKECNEVPGRRSHLFITQSLPKGAYDIDENEYLITGAKSRWSWRHFAGSLAS